MLRKRVFLFLALVAFQFSFGLFYDWQQFGKKQHFDPFLSSSEYKSLIVRAAAEFFPAGDIEAYHRAAYTLAESGQISLPNGRPSAWVTPGYPLALATLYKVFGYHFFPVIFFNAVCLALAYFLLANAAGILFGSRVWISTLVLLAANLRMSMFVGYVYTECLFVLCVAAAIALAVQISLRSGKARHWVMLGFICGYGTLVRPIFIVATGVLAAYLGFCVIARFRSNLRPFLAFLGLSLFLPSLWVYRNQTQLHFPIVSTSSAQAMADGNQDFYKQFRFFDTSQYVFNESLLSGHLPALHAKNPELALFIDFQNRFRTWKAENTSFYYWLTAWRAKTMLSPYVEDMSSMNKAISTVLWILIFPAALMGLILNRRNAWLWVIFLISLFSLLLPAFVIVGPSLRYQIPSQLLLSILAAYFYESVLSRNMLKGNSCTEAS